MRIRKDIPIEPGDTVEINFIDLFGDVHADRFQIACTAKNAAGEPITPVSGTLRTWIKPKGGNEFLEGDEDLNIAEGEFYLIFPVEVSDFKFEAMNISPEVDHVVATVSISW